MQSGFFGSSLSGDELIADVKIDAWKSCFTPDGMKYFSNFEQLISYISEKCGKDVADLIKPMVDSDLAMPNDDEFSMWEHNLDEYNCEVYAKKGHLNPIVELKTLRRLVEDYNKAFDFLIEIRGGYKEV